MLQCHRALDADIRTLWGASELIHFERGFPSHYLLAAHDGSAVHEFSKRAAALFAVAPVVCFEFEVENCEPWADVRVGSDAGSWRAELYVRAGSPAAGPVDELLAPSRKALADGFERWLLQALAEVCFEIAEEVTGVSPATRA